MGAGPLPGTPPARRPASDAPEPSVTVIIPSYNRADLLARAVRGVLAQTMPDWELIVVDDGSTDHSAAVMAGFLNDPRIRWVPQPHVGVSAARNRGAAQARGEFLAFLDQDDVWMPAKLERQRSLMRSDPAMVLSATWSEVVDPAGRPLSLFRPDAEGIRDRLVETNVLQGGASSTMARRTAFESLGGFDPELQFSCDWDMWLRLAAIGRVGIVAQPLARYQLNPWPSWWPPAQAERDVRRFYDKVFANPHLPRSARRRSHKVRGLASVARFHWRHGYPVDAARVGAEMLLRSPPHTWKAFLEYLEKRKRGVMLL